MAVGPLRGTHISNAGEWMGVILKHDLGDWSLCKCQGTQGMPGPSYGFMAKLNSK